MADKKQKNKQPSGSSFTRGSQIFSHNVRMFITLCIHSIFGLVSQSVHMRARITFIVCSHTPPIIVIGAPEAFRWAGKLLEAPAIESCLLDSVPNEF